MPQQNAEQKPTLAEESSSLAKEAVHVAQVGAAKAGEAISAGASVANDKIKDSTGVDIRAKTGEAVDAAKDVAKKAASGWNVFKNVVADTANAANAKLQETTGVDVKAKIGSAADAAREAASEGAHALGDKLAPKKPPSENE